MIRCVHSMQGVQGGTGVLSVPPLFHPWLDPSSGRSAGPSRRSPLSEGGGETRPHWSFLPDRMPLLARSRAFPVDLPIRWNTICSGAALKRSMNGRSCIVFVPAEPEDGSAHGGDGVHGEDPSLNMPEGSRCGIAARRDAWGTFVFPTDLS